MYRHSMAVVSLLMLAVAFSGAAADVPRLITYQGKLTDASGKPVPDDKYLLQFGLYTDSLAGTVLWTEEQTVMVEQGLFNVQLGLVDSLPIDPFYKTADIFLGMAIKGESEMKPRIRLTSSAYSFYALTVAEDAVGSSQIMDGSIRLHDLHQDGAVEGEVVTWTAGEWQPEAAGDITEVRRGPGWWGAGPRTV